MGRGPKRPARRPGHRDRFRSAQPSRVNGTDPSILILPTAFQNEGPGLDLSLSVPEVASKAQGEAFDITVTTAEKKLRSVSLDWLASGEPF